MKRKRPTFFEPQSGKRSKTIDIEKLTSNILSWWDNEKITPPWGDTKDPYKIWIALIMGQQTNINIVKKEHKKWIEKFPDIKSCASASKSKIKKYWKLGYNNRALNIRKCAKIVINTGFPKSVKELKNLPGIGMYTASALASICFNQVTPVIDVNVTRIMKRVYMIYDKDDVKKKALNMIKVNPKRCGDINQAIMDLGVYICKPKKQKCEKCPISKMCNGGNFISEC